MEIIKKIGENKILIKIIGRLDTTTAPELELVINESVVPNLEEITFDYEKLEYVSSAGLRVMLMAQKKANETNTKIKIINMSEEVYEVFELTGFHEVLEIEGHNNVDKID